MKNFKKKSTKFKVGVIAFIIFMIILVSYVLYSTFKPDEPVSYDMVKASKGEITDYLDVSGTVESGVTEKFTAIEGVMVEEVLVSVGDNVKKGDLLATFNVSGATKYVNEAKKDYESALKDYNDAKTASSENAKRKAELSKEIAEIEKEIAELEKEIAELEAESETATKPETTTAPGTTEERIELPEVVLAATAVNTANSQAKKSAKESATAETTTVKNKIQLTQEQIDTIVAEMKKNGATNEQIKAVLDAIEVQTDRISMAQETIDAIIKQMRENGATDDEVDAFIESVEPETDSSIITEDTINDIVSGMENNGATKDEIDKFIESVEPGIEVTVPSQGQIDDAVDSATQIQTPVISPNNANQNSLVNKNVELAQLNAQLSSLQAENAALISTDDESVLESLKAVADAQKATYETIKEIYNTMKNGWYAENEGIVTVVNLKAGEKFVPVADQSATIDLSAILGESMNGQGTNLISSLINDSVSVPTGTGITLESYDDMIVSVTVGKSDLLKIKVGMEAVVTSLDSEYEAEVVYVGATALDNSGNFDLNSLTSSLMGGAGGANGALVKVKIHNPDEKVVIGFDVDIKIKLQTVEDVLKVPVESVIYNNGTYFVYVYNKDEGTASKRTVVKGTLDDVNYEIVSGLKEGEMVIKSPDPNMEDGTAVQQKTA